MIGKQQKLLQRILPLVLFGTLWYLLIKHLSVRWAVNPQYSFGWFVPVISAYLFLIRWRSRPAVEFAHSAVAKWVFCTAGFALLPTWLVEQPNPDWRLISWLLAFEIVTLSLCAIYFVGGKILAQTLRVQHLLHTSVGTVAERRGGFRHSGINTGGDGSDSCVSKPLPYLGGAAWKCH